MIPTPLEAGLAEVAPAGLNAALTLGRARRRVVLADAGPGSHR
ncbi:hypothetical protein AB0B45_31515 [Nonomuraea sp. NPDC049152]